MSYMVDDSVSPIFDHEQFVLEHVQIAACEVVSASVMATMRLDVLPHVVGDALLFQLRAYLQAEHLADESRDFQFSWPRSRWQAFKLRHPGRFVRRLPVKHFRATANVAVKSWATFPESKIVAPDLGRPLYIQQMTYRSSAEPAFG